VYALGKPALQDSQPAPAPIVLARDSRRLEDYQMQLMLLENENKKRLIKAREGQDALALR